MSKHHNQILSLLKGGFYQKGEGRLEDGIGNQNPDNEMADLAP
jgi:hypothetical protein